jgi:hypothetical protein
LFGVASWSALPELGLELGVAGFGALTAREAEGAGVTGFGVPVLAAA